MLPIQTISFLLGHNEQPIVQALPQHSLAQVLPSVSSEDEMLEIGAEVYKGATVLHRDPQLQTDSPVHKPNPSIPSKDVTLQESDQVVRNVLNFTPFFTVIEDTTTGEHHHPHVHYLFSDDDPDLITNAVLDTLDLPIPDNEDSPDGQSSKERYIIFDMAVDGRSVVSTKSLSQDWQILNTTVTTAPTFKESSAEDGVLMLHVEGLESVLPGAKISCEAKLEQARSAETGNIFAAMSSLADQFQQELDRLRKITMPEIDRHAKHGLEGG